MREAINLHVHFTTHGSLIINVHEQSNYRHFCQMNKSERNVIIRKTAEKRWQSTLMVIFSTTTALRFQRWLLAPPGDLAATDFFFFFFKYSSSPSSLQMLRLSIGRVFLTCRVSLPFYIDTRTLHKNLQTNNTKHSQPFHFPTTKTFSLQLLFTLNVLKKWAALVFRGPRYQYLKKEHR